MKVFKIFLLVFLPVFSMGQDWVLESQTEYYKAYTKTSEDGKIKSYKIEATLNVAMDVLVNKLSDIEDFPNWMPNIAKVNVLKSIKNQSITYFMEIAMPWPLTNRFGIIESSIQKGKGYFKASSKTLSDGLGENDDLVRIALFEETIEITAIHSLQCKMVINGKLDPGGSIPAWMMNMFATDGPIQTIEALKKLED